MIKKSKDRNILSLKNPVKDSAMSVKVRELWQVSEIGLGQCLRE